MEVVCSDGTRKDSGLWEEVATLLEDERRRPRMGPIWNEEERGASRHCKLQAIFAASRSSAPRLSPIASMPIGRGAAVLAGVTAWSPALGGGKDCIAVSMGGWRRVDGWRTSAGAYFPRLAQRGAVTCCQRRRAPRESARSELPTRHLTWKRWRFGHERGLPAVA
jgi:hypothetical protein